MAALFEEHLLSQRVIDSLEADTSLEDDLLELVRRRGVSSTG